jgi:putative aldouronate transport system substrate-binding protein
MKSTISRRKFLTVAGMGAGAALLAACGAPAPAAPAEPAAPAATQAPAAEAPAAEAPAEAPASVAGATLTYWAPLSANVAATLQSFNEMTCYKALQEITGVKLDFQHVPDNPQAVEAFNLLIASGKFPDIIETNWLGFPGGPAKALKDGVITRLNETIDGGKSPAFAKVLADHPEWRKMILTDEGDIYCYPFLRGDPGLQTFSGPYVRKDYLDKAGVNESPKTIDDWTAMFKALKGQDLNGNGQADEYPFTSWLGGKGQNGYSYGGAFAGAYGTTIGFYNEGGTVKYGPLDPSFKDFLTTVAGWWKEGYVHPDTFTMDAKAFDAQQTSGNIGSGVLLVGGGIGRLTTLARQTDPEFTLEGVIYPSLKAGEKAAFGQMDNVYPGSASAAITTQCTNVDAALTVLDYPYSEAGHLLFNFGVEGQQYDMVNGFPKWRDEIVKPEKLPLAQSIAQHARSNFAGPFVQDIRYLEQYFALPEQKAAYETWGQADLSRVMPPVTPTQDESRDFAKIMSEVNPRLEEVFAKVATNAEPLEAWDAFMGELEQLGIQDAIKIQQAALQRYNARQ